MARNLILFLRVLGAAALGMGGLFSLSVGLYMVASRDFVLLGAPGVGMLAGVLVGAALLYVSGRLIKTTLAAPVS